MSKLIMIGSNSMLCRKYMRTYQGREYLKVSRSEDADIHFNMETDRNFSAKHKRKLGNARKAILFAGITDIRYIEKNVDEAYYLNYKCSASIIEALNREGVECLIISTTAVFNENTYKNSERDMKNASCIYGELKSKLEDRCLQNDLNCVLRLTKVIGANSILNKWQNELSKGRVISCFGNLKVAPLPAVFAAQAIDRWVEKSFQGIYHGSPDRDISYFELGHWLATEKSLNYDHIIKSEVDDKNVPYRPVKANLTCVRKESMLFKLGECLDQIYTEYLR